MLILRSESPGRFCAIVSLFFVMTAVIGHLVSGAVVVYTILVSAFLSPVFLTRWSTGCFFPDDQNSHDHELESKSDVFDALKTEESQEKGYNLDHELGIVSPGLEREGSTSSSGKSSIRIIASHFSGRNSSGSDDAGLDSADDSSPNEEPFEMISDTDVRSDETI